MSTDTRTHDAECERRPGGRYDGITLQDGGTVPCHCTARRDGAALADAVTAAVEARR